MTHLPTAVLGRTGLEVTRLGFGAGHRKPMDDVQRETIHNAVLDAGINYIDTAGCYGNSEELIGRYLSSRSSEFYLATKCGCTSNGTTWSRDSVFGDLHRSLKRLKADYVDVMQPHNPSVAESEKNQLVDALVDMRDQGKVRWIGISTTLPHLPTYLDWGVFDVFQVPYSALERDHEGWITKAAESGIGIVIRGGAALGEPGGGCRRRRQRGKVRGGPTGRAPRGGGEPDCLHPATHTYTPSLRYEHRGHNESGPR